MLARMLSTVQFTKALSIRDFFATTLLYHQEYIRTVIPLAILLLFNLFLSVFHWLMKSFQSFATCFSSGHWLYNFFCCHGICFPLQTTAMTCCW
jgi:hypothetical protein